MGAFDHLECIYDGAFEQRFGLGRGEFEHKFSKNSNARGLPGGMSKLRFDWYIIKQRLEMPHFGIATKIFTTQTVNAWEECPPTV